MTTIRIAKKLYISIVLLLGGFRFLMALFCFCTTSTKALEVDYSETFKNAKFKWTPTFMFYWLANPMKMFPESNMMSLGVPDSQDRSDLIAYLIQASESDL